MFQGHHIKLINGFEIVAGVVHVIKAESHISDLCWNFGFDLGIKIHRTVFYPSQPYRQLSSDFDWAFSLEKQQILRAGF